MQMGTLDAAAKVLQVGLLGNPNTGKSSLFNRLTGLRQRVGNYPGVTVEKKEGVLRHEGHELHVYDMPGSYSLAATSPDERVVLDSLCGRIPGMQRFDVVVCVLDATNLQRNLFLAAQIADLGVPAILALNLWDEAQAKGLAIDTRLLSERLGVPCIPTNAKTGLGVREVKDAILGVAASGRVMRRLEWPGAVGKAVADLRAALPEGVQMDDALLRRVLFEADSAVAQGIGWTAAERKQHLDRARKHLFDAGYNPLAAEALLHYNNLRLLADGVVRSSAEINAGRSESIDRLLIHRGWGLAIFVALMYLVFQAVYSWAGPFMDLIETGVGWVQGLASGLLEGSPILQSLVRDGIIGGIGAFVVFLPQILILFFFVAFLEDSGYMARAAFLMDKLFSWCGLNGKSFVPLLSSYACAIPGIMATRTIGDPKARLTTILIAPLMSCSARLPVYVLIIGVFIEPVYGAFWAGFALFAMHFLGLAVAIPVAWLLNRFVLRTPSQPFILEMPPYRAPRLRDVLLRMWLRGYDFIKTAGTVIFAMTVIIWALLYFPRPETVEEQARGQFVAHVIAGGASQADVEAALEEPESELALALDHAVESAYVEQSYLGRFGKLIQPIFEPAGFDWKITVGIVSSFPAREVIISTLGIIYRLGGDVDEGSDELHERMTGETWQSGNRAGQVVYTMPVAIALMVFFSLCQQCGATVAVIARETGWKWAVFSFVYMTSLAWIGAVAVYQLGSLL